MSVDGGSTATYAYDQSNQRYKKVVGSTPTHYIWQGSQVIAEHNGSTGAVITDYISSSRRMIAKVSSGTTQYFLSDRLSERLVLDSSGSVIGRMAHLPFGEDFGESGTQEKHHFTSYERDSETGTDYAINRQYAQNLGRFMRVDPVLGPIKSPQRSNRYAYVSGDPIGSVDPLGLAAVTFCFWNIVELDGPNYLGLEFEGCITFDLPTKAEPGPRNPPEPCDVVVPTDPNIRAAVAVLLGEATSEYRLGQRQYQDGDRPNHPTGETVITEDILYAEMVEMVDVIANRARIGGFGGSTWADVATSGAFFGYAAGDAMLKANRFGANGSPLCERLRRAVKAANYVAQSGPSDTTVLYWVAVVQGRGRGRHVRRQGGATRFGDTDFSDTPFR